MSSTIAEVELGRALLRRRAHPTLRRRARRLLEACELVDVTEEIRALVAELRPTAVRSFDAIHVATAVAADLADFTSYDSRQRVAAEEAGLALAIA